MTEPNATEPCVFIGMDAGEIGWVRFTLRVAQQEFSYDISDLTDALGDLIRAALQIACGGHIAQAVFQLEPGDLFIHLERVVPSNPKLQIRIREERGAGEIELYRAEAGPDQFAKAVLGAAGVILATSGEKGFETRWDRPFPVRAMAALKRALATPSPL